MLGGPDPPPRGVNLLLGGSDPPLSSRTFLDCAPPPWKQKGPMTQLSTQGDPSWACAGVRAGAPTESISIALLGVLHHAEPLSIRLVDLQPQSA